MALPDVVKAAGTLHRRLVDWAWQFSKMQYVADLHGDPFVSMQDHTT